MDIFLKQLIPFYLNNSSPFNPTHYVVLYPQNGDRIVAIDSVTSLRLSYREFYKYNSLFKINGVNYSQRSLGQTVPHINDALTKQKIF